MDGDGHAENKEDIDADRNSDFEPSKKADGERVESDGHE